jgi:hypothetical protein
MTVVSIGIELDIVLVTDVSTVPPAVPVVDAGMSLCTGIRLELVACACTLIAPAMNSTAAAVIDFFM